MQMTMKNSSILWGNLLFVFLIACTSPNTEQVGFKELCEEQDHTWMKMQPMENGVEMGKGTCTGCHVDDENHFCNFAKYKTFLEG